MPLWYYKYNQKIKNIINNELYMKINTVFRRSKPVRYECPGLLFVRYQNKTAHPERPCLLAETAMGFKNISVQILDQVFVFVSAWAKQRHQLNWQNHKRKKQHIKNESHVNVSLSQNAEKLSIIHLFWINHTIERDWCCNDS